MKLWTDLGWLTLRRIRAALRNPIFLCMGVGIPTMYLALFTPLLKTVAENGGLHRGNILTLFVPGMLPIIAFSTGIFTGFHMIDEVCSGVLERFRVTPTSRFAILAGPVLFDTCTALIQSLLFVLIALPFGFRASPFGMCLLFLLLAMLTLITSSLGNALGVILKDDSRYAPLVHGMNLPILLLSGTLLPMSLAPFWLKGLAHCNPVFYVVEAARTLALGHLATPRVLRAFSILTPLVIVTMAWATKVFRKVVT